MDLAKRVRPADKELIHFDDAAEIREEIAAANRNYDGIQHLKNAEMSFNGAAPGFVKAGCVRRQTVRVT